MTDAEIIRATWEKIGMYRITWVEGVVVSLPPPHPTAFSGGREPCYEQAQHVHFWRETGQHNGRPADRIMGKFRDTEIMLTMNYAPMAVFA